MLQYPSSLHFICNMLYSTDIHISRQDWRMDSTFLFCTYFLPPGSLSLRVHTSPLPRIPQPAYWTCPFYHWVSFHWWPPCCLHKMGGRYFHKYTSTNSEHDQWGRSEINEQRNLIHSASVYTGMCPRDIHANCDVLTSCFTHLHLWVLLADTGCKREGRDNLLCPEHAQSSPRIAKSYQEVSLSAPCVHPE